MLQPQISPSVLLSLHAVTMTEVRIAAAAALTSAKVIGRLLRSGVEIRWTGGIFLGARGILIVSQYLSDTGSVALYRTCVSMLWNRPAIVLHRAAEIATGTSSDADLYCPIS